VVVQPLVLRTQLDVHESVPPLKPLAAHVWPLKFAPSHCSPVSRIPFPQVDEESGGIEEVEGGTGGVGGEEDEGDGRDEGGKDETCKPDSVQIFTLQSCPLAVAFHKHSSRKMIATLPFEAAPDWMKSPSAGSVGEVKLIVSSVVEAGVLLTMFVTGQVSADQLKES